MNVLKKIVLILLFVVIGIFIFQNLGNVEVKFLTWQLTITRSVLYIILYVLGMTTGGILVSSIKKLLQK
jgi:uncharacterized integral membrane protein